METLVLDQGYQPVARVSWKRAITLLFQDKIEVVDSYEDKQIRSVSFSMKMPSVVRFLHKIRRRKPAIKFSRENVYARDGGKCQYCRGRVERHESTYDHVIPRAQGGRTTWENVVICCVACNQKKGCRPLSQAGMYLRVLPVKPRKLPRIRFTITWEKGMPVSWKTWARDYQYWNAELES